MQPDSTVHKAARLAAIYLLTQSGELDLSTTSQAELGRRFGVNRSTILKDLRQLPTVTRLASRYLETYRADEAAGIRQ